jgi:hypothetical protein
MLQPLEGIEERLKRANENIRNLEVEINQFLAGRGLPEVVHSDLKSIEQFKEFWSKQDIPPRFATLTGEILHNCRAALDNLVWELVREAGHNPRNPNVIEFPILTAKPTAPAKIASFNQKIEGVSTNARAIIESLQPYNAVSPWHGPNYALLVLHNLNRFDKHRELTVIGSTSQQKPDMYLLQVSGVHIDPATGNKTERLLAYREICKGMRLTAVVVFRQFGDMKNMGVIPGLTRIEAAVREAVKMFDGFFHPR